MSKDDRIALLALLVVLLGAIALALFFKWDCPGPGVLIGSVLKLGGC